jgi:hypothetical protein
LSFTANSWGELTELVSQVKVPLDFQKGEEPWYRGVSDASHKLLPSLFRTFDRPHPSRYEVNKRESDLFFEFLSKARTSFDQARDDWDVLFLMQHYGVPTRLLDWTEVLLVALYFATKSVSTRPQATPRIYVLNPYVWNDKHPLPNCSDAKRDLVWPRFVGRDIPGGRHYQYGEILTERGGVGWEFPVALYPPQRDPRLSAQRGYFTLHGFNHGPLDEIDANLIAKIDLSPQCVNEVLAQIHHAGINEYTIFPDLDGLARSLRQKYGLS